MSLLKRGPIQYSPKEYQVGIRRWTNDRLSGFQALQQGHGRRTIAPDQLFHHWDKAYGTLIALLGTRKRAEMILEGLRLEAIYGQAFASAHHYAAHAGCNEKTWDRLVTYLRGQGWLEVTRLWRRDGTKSTNLISFRRLWAWVMALVRYTIRQVKGRGRKRLLKISAAWYTVVETVAFLTPPRLHGGKP